MDTSTALEASSSSSPSSSSTTTSSSSSPYDVFLSFSGEDTRKTFTDHLYWTMKDAGIDFFMEENESIRRGENISEKVKQIIEGSRVSVIVFSSRYADSIWCLEELVQIMECRRTLKQMVLPIFYDLSPSDGIGTFVQAFQRHRERFHEDTDIQEKIWRWTDALTEAAGLTEWVFETTNGYEGMFIREIIDEITRQLKSPTPVGIAFSELQGLHSPKLEDIVSTEHTDTASSGFSAKSSLTMLSLKKWCHEPDHSDSTSRKFSELQRSHSPKLEDIVSTEHSDTASSGFSAKSSLTMLSLKKRCHEPDHSDSTSRKFPKRRSPGTPVLDSTMSDVLSDLPPITNSGSLAETKHEPVSSHIDILTDKTMLESQALVAIPEMSMEPLAVVPVSQKTKRSEFAQRRIRRPFSVSEVEALVIAVEELGIGRWRDVKLRAFENADHRTYVDLKDKWKTLVHMAQISPQQRRGEPVPQELLDRVLAAHSYWCQHQAKQHGKHPALPAL